MSRAESALAHKHTPSPLQPARACAARGETVRTQVEKTVLDFDQAHDLLVTKNHNMFPLQMRSSRACMLRLPVRAACPACSDVS